MSFGLIFDVDGVIADTEDLVARATIAVFRELYGVELTPEDFTPFIGTGALRYTQGPAEKLGLDINIDEALKKRHENFVALLEACDSVVFPGVKELIGAVAADPAWTMAIATSAPGEKASATLAAADVPLSSFAAYITGDMVSKKKPDPEIYLTASNVISIQPRNCVVIEDALAGVQAAKAAGMGCIAVTNSFSRAELSQADVIVDSLTEVDMNTLRNLVS